MEKDKSPNHGGALLPPSGRHSVFSAQGNNNNNSSSLNVKAEPLPPLALGSSSISESGRFSQDISRMPDNPPKRSVGHRRAHSEILTLPDDISFDSDLGVVGGGIDDGGPSFSDDTEEDLFSMYLDMDKFNYSSPSSTATSSFQVGEFTTAADQSTVAVNPSPAAAAAAAEDLGPTSNERWPRIRHQHSQSMDGSSTIKPDMLMSSSADANKSLSAAKLSELALVDPKRAKRIWANRQSAARSKERKMRYIAELERKVQILQTQATSVSAQLTLLQRDTNGLNAENGELKLRLQTMEQQVHLQDALNEALKEEIQHLKVVTGQTTLPNGGGGGAMPMMMNFPPPSSSFGYPNNNNNNNAKAKVAMHSVFTAHQFQHLHIQSQKQQQQFQQQQLLQLQQQQQMQQQQQQQQQQMVQSGGDLKMRANKNEHTTTTTTATDRYEA